MSLANQKGGFNVTLRVQQNSSSESLCVLQKPLIKKAENWSLQVTDLFLNKVAPLNRVIEEQLRIVPYEWPLSAGYVASDYIFTPTHCFTICEYLIQIQEFFNKFSFLFWKYGVTNPMGTTAAQNAAFIVGGAIATTPVNYTKRNMVGDGTVDEGYAQYPVICSCSLGSDLKIRFKFEPVFLANFFVGCSDSFVKHLDVPPFLFRVYLAGVFGIDHLPPTLFFDALVGAPQPNGYPLFRLAAAINIREVPPNAMTWFSGMTIRELDDRLSIDLVTTFPASRKINILDGVEQHEFLIARFDLSNYKKFNCVTTQDDIKMSSSIKIIETYNAGLDNLTRGNADYASNLLMQGSIQQIHLMLYTRYLENNKIKRVKTDLEDGFWHTRMLFSKKT